MDSSLLIDDEEEKDDNVKTEPKTEDKEPPEVEDLDMEAVPDEAEFMDEDDDDDDDIMSPDHEDEEEELEHEIEITRVKIEAVVAPPQEKGKVENSNQLISNPTELRKASPIDDNHKVISGNIIVEETGSIGGKENETEKNKGDETEKGANEKEEIKKPTENQVLVSSIKGSHGQTNSTDKENFTTNLTDISSNDIPQPPPSSSLSLSSLPQKQEPLETSPEDPQAALQQQLQAPPESQTHPPLPPASPQAPPLPPASPQAPPESPMRPPLPPASSSDNEKAEKNNDSEKSSHQKENSEVKHIVTGEGLGKLMNIHKAYGKELMRSSSKGQLGRKAAQMREDGHPGAGPVLGNPYMYDGEYREYIRKTVFRKPEQGEGWTFDTDHDNLISQDKVRYIIHYTLNTIH